MNDPDKKAVDIGDLVKAHLVRVDAQIDDLQKRLAVLEGRMYFLETPASLESRRATGDPDAVRTRH
ncbi:MAG: hypothetical protein ABI859_08165 [Pseudomonadota bacterium]